MNSDSQNLVLCPGLLCDGAVWESQIAALESVSNITVGDFAHVDSIAAMAEGVLAAAPARFALAGFSMGGYVSFEIMRRAPERVTRLALIDTTAYPDSDAQSQRRRDLMALSRRGEFRGVTPRLMSLLLHPKRLEQEALTGAIEDMATRVGADAFLRQQTAILERADSRPDLASITCPSLVLAGRQDSLIPIEHQAMMAETMVGADLTLLGECGHMAPMERPRAVTQALLAWLEG